MGTNAFQECPAIDITKSITKWSYCVTDPTEIDYVIDRAFFIANDKKKGAVHIDLPKSVLTEIPTKKQSLFIPMYYQYYYPKESLNNIIDVINNLTNLY